MASVRGASSIPKYEALPNSLDKYTLECYKLNKRIQEWEKEKAFYQKKYVKRFRNFIKTTDFATDLPNFFNVYKKYLPFYGVDEKSDKIPVSVFFGVFDVETEEYASTIYLLELLKKFHNSALQDSERKYILNCKLNVELSDYFIEDLKNARKLIEAYFKKQEEMKILHDSLETLKSMRIQLDQVSSLLNQNGLDISQPKETIQQGLDICAQNIETFTLEKDKSR